MRAPGLRHDESRALASLRALEVLDTAPEAAFDALVRTAGLVCGAPIALLSLIDAERQWFKAKVGLPGVAETPRNIAFCAHAVLGREVLEVPDATLDPRFAESPLVTGAPAIRFYAGAPVRTDGGHSIGTICVIDQKPRELDGTQRQVLECLAVAAGRALESRRACIALNRLTRENEEQMRRLYERTPAMLHSIDEDGRIVTVSDRWLERMGYTREQVLGRPSTDFLAAPSRQYAKTVVLPRLFKTGVCDDAEFQMVTRHGEIIDAVVSAFLERAGDGTPIRSLAVTTDLTLRRQAEKADREAQHELAVQSVTLRSVAEAIPDMVTVLSADGKYRFANGAFQAWCGKSMSDILGRQASEVLGDAEFQRRCHWAAQSAAGERVEFELDYPSCDGTTYLGIRHIPLRLQSGEVDGMVVVARDITKQKQEERRLVSLSRRDPLTGVLNRAGMDHFLEQQWQSGSRLSMGLLYIDLDHFKPVNDRFGHAAGDHVLRAFAKRLVQLVRPTDAVARHGGDEFVVALQGISSHVDVQMVAEKVLAAARAPFNVGNTLIQVGASVGIATAALGDFDWHELVDRADANLLQAKRAGRGQHAGAPSAGAYLAEQPPFRRTVS